MFSMAHIPADDWILVNYVGYARYNMKIREHLQVSILRRFVVFSVSSTMGTIKNLRNMQYLWQTDVNKYK